MKVGMQREKLEHEMRKTIIDINLSRKQQERVASILTAKGFLPGDVQKIINGNKPIDFMHEINLGVVAKALYKATSNTFIFYVCVVDANINLSYYINLTYYHSL